MQQIQQLNVRVVGLALSVLFGVSYIVCALAYLLFPGLAMFRALVGLFPGFGWSFGGVLLGLVEAILYAWWSAVIYVPTYNYLQRRGVAVSWRSRPPLAA